MKRLVFVTIAIICVVVPNLALAQTEYATEVLDRYHECMERNDLQNIRDLVWYHTNVEKIDASIYGLPQNDFDDRSDLSINERLDFRRNKARLASQNPTAVPPATRGPVQYPHHLRAAFDENYNRTGARVDCSSILEGNGTLDSPIGPRVLASGWSGDYNLTGSDSSDRGEVDIAVDPADPSRIMASSAPGGGSETSNHISYSSDYGQSWTNTQVGNNSGSSWECDPVSYYQRSTGRVYHAKIGCSNGQCAQTYTMLRYSTNNGSSWSDCGRPGSQGSEDREWMVVDNNPGSTCYGNIYTTWHNSNQQKVARSTNNCSSWSGLTNLTGTYQAITPDISLGADGHIYSVWQNHGDSTFKIAGSNNCGASWGSPAAKTLANRNGNWTNNIPAQCQRGVASQPVVDVDRASNSQYYNRVYVGLWMFSGSCATQAGWSCSNWDSNWNNTCNYDFHLMYSDNGGSTFSSPVNITAGDGNTVDHFMGYMRVDEADGSIYVGYHRSRLNPTSAADRRKTNFYIMRSIDGGVNWEEFRASAYEGDERLSGGSSFERGDYHGIAVKDGVTWPVWIDRRGGSGEEEIVTRKICSEPAHWSERAPSFNSPATSVSNGSGGAVTVSWASPDIYWGDGGENTSSRKYQLWVDGSLAQDNLSWSSNSTSYTPGNTSSHSYRVRAVNQCSVAKDYASQSFSAAGGCGNSPTSVNVTPNGPLTLCTGSGQTLSASVSGGSGLSYQWTRDGSNISGATSSTYYANDTGSHAYNVTVTGSGCSTGVQDTSNTSITWGSAPDFGGSTGVNAGASCSLQIDWDAATPLCSTGVSYHVYRSTSSGFSPSSSNRIASCVSGNTYNDASVSSGSTYYYVVRAEDGASGGSGPCNGGNIDSNTVRQSGVLSSGGSTLIDDDFTSGADWTVSTGPGAHSCGDWVLTTSATQRPPSSVGNYALADSDACGSSSTTSTILTGKVVNAAGASSLTLEFDMYYRYYNGEDTKVEVWDGFSWVTVWADSNSTVQAHQSINVTAQANEFFQVRFSYQNAAWDWWMAIDNVNVTAAGLGSCR